MGEPLNSVEILLIFGFFLGWGVRGVVFSIIDGWHAEAFRREELRHQKRRREAAAARSADAEGAA